MAKIGIKDIIATSDHASAVFDKAVSTSEQKMFEEVLLLIKNLETTPQGNIKTSIANLKRVQQIRSKLYRLANNKDYLQAVRELVGVFDTIYRQQLSFYAVKNQSSVAEQKHNLVKNIARENTIAALTGDGLATNVTAQLDKMLLRAVTSGARFVDLQQELSDYLLTSAGGNGALSRYAKTYAVTALSQYAGQNNKLFTDDLDTEWYEYVGSEIETTRPFCEACLKKRYIHRSEFHDLLRGHIHIVGGDDIDVKLYDKTDLPYGMIEGINEENLQINVGGWNCRHQLIPIAAEAVPENIRKEIDFATKTQKKLDEHNAKNSELNLPTAKGKLLATTPATAVAIGTYEQLTNAIQAIYAAKTRYEKNNLLRSITQAEEYQPIKQFSFKEGSVFGYSAEQYDFKNENEIPKNIHLASKIAKSGYNTYLVPNIGGSVSADYILKRKNSFLYAEGKITNGKQGIYNAIHNGSHQSKCIIIDVQMNATAQSASGQLQIGFQHNKSVMEVWLYKGSRRIIIKRQWAETRRFDTEFRKEWDKK